MFEAASAFNADLRAWDLSSVTEMRELFLDATSFKGGLGNFFLSSLCPHRVLVGWCVADDVNLDASSFAGAACEADACGVARDCDDVIDEDTSDTTPSTATCADDQDWRRDGDPDHTCASVEAANAKKKWKKKKVDRPRIAPRLFVTHSTLGEEELQGQVRGRYQGEEGLQVLGLRQIPLQEEEEEDDRRGVGRDRRACSFPAFKRPDPIDR